MHYTNTLTTFKNEYAVSIEAKDDRELYKKLDQVSKWIQFEGRHKAARPEYLLFCTDGSHSCEEFEWVGKIFAADDAKSIYEEYVEHAESLKAEKAKKRTVKRIVFFPFFAQARSIKSSFSDLKLIGTTIVEVAQYSKAKFTAAKEEKFASQSDDDDVVKRPIELWEPHQFVFFGLLFLISLAACFHTKTPSIFLFGLIPLCFYIFAILSQQALLRFMEDKKNGE